MWPQSIQTNLLVHSAFFCYMYSCSLLPSPLLFTEIAVLLDSLFISHVVGYPVTMSVSAATFPQYYQQQSVASKQVNWVCIADVIVADVFLCTLYIHTWSNFRDVIEKCFRLFCVCVYAHFPLSPPPSPLSPLPSPHLPSPLSPLLSSLLGLSPPPSPLSPLLQAASATTFLFCAITFQVQLTAHTSNMSHLQQYCSLYMYMYMYIEWYNDLCTRINSIQYRGKSLWTRLMIRVIMYYPLLSSPPCSPLLPLLLSPLSSLSSCLSSPPPPLVSPLLPLLLSPLSPQYQFVMMLYNVVSEKDLKLRQVSSP